MASFSDDLVEEEVQIHLILIGHTGVGKTSLRKHLKNEPIDMNESPTIVMEPEFLYRESMEVTSSIPFKTIKEALKNSKSKVSLTMWDTGGQPIFQDLLPCFARLKCMYGIVFRLPDLQNFDSRPDIRPCNEFYETATSPFTSKDIVYRNLAYVQAFSCNLRDKLRNLQIPGQHTKDSLANTSYPAAVVVGTCRDIVSHSDESLIEEKKKELDEGISDFVHSYNVSVCNVPVDKNSFIHEIDNTSSGNISNTDCGIDFLRDNISQCAQQSSTKIHKSWKLFETRLQRLCYTTHVNLGIIPLIDAVAIGKECHVSDPKAALMYFHELGTFMWYHLSEKGSMKKFVVIDPKILLEILAKLFCFNPNSLPSDSKPLIKKGIITIDSFRNLLTEKASNIDDSWFMAFLEEHHLSIKVIGQNDIYYFLPSLLATKSDYYKNFTHFTSESSLYIVPQSGYIATGMFTRLLTALAGVTYGSTVWRIPMIDSFLRDVCRNQFEFVVSESVHVILSEFSKHIRIDCIPYEDAVIEKDLYFNIVSTLDVQLQRIVPRWIENREFSFGFACKKQAVHIMRRPFSSS